MAYKQNNRVAKQKKRAAIRRTKEQHSGTIAGRYYLTISKRQSHCVMCDCQIQKGGESVYRHEPQSVLCVPCAQSSKVDWRVSTRWEAARVRKLTPANT